MNIVLISIGDELLSGDTLNSNVTWIGNKLTPLGCSIIEHRTIPDNAESIQHTLDDILKKEIQYVIITGGLGPTDDDITRQTIFDYIGTDAEFDEEYWTVLVNRFKKYGITIPESNRNQALTPSKGKIIPNPIGSARGFIFTINNIQLICLPGVPEEMKAMMNQTVIPQISSKDLTPKYITNIRTTGIAESALIEKIEHVTSNQDSFKIGYYPSLIGVDIRITGRNRTTLNDFSNQLINALGQFYFATGKESLESIVINLGIEKGKTLSVAESCTGGLVGHRLTEVSGSSNVFLGGVVVYGNKAKETLLNVNHDTLEQFGAVSEETAKEMAFNVKQLFKSDYGLAITGIAGPTGGTPEKPVGLIFIALAKSSGTTVKKLKLGSHRSRNKLKTSQIVLNWLRLTIEND